MIVDELELNFEQTECRRKLKFYSKFWLRIVSGIFCRKSERIDIKDIREQIEKVKSANQPIDRNQKNKKKLAAYQKYRQSKYDFLTNLIKVQKTFLKEFSRKFSFKNKVFFKFYYFVANTKLLAFKHERTLDSLNFFLKNEYLFQVTAQSFRLFDYNLFLK